MDMVVIVTVYIGYKTIIYMYLYMFQACSYYNIVLLYGICISEKILTCLSKLKNLVFGCVLRIGPLLMTICS